MEAFEFPLSASKMNDLLDHFGQFGLQSQQNANCWLKCLGTSRKEKAVEGHSNKGRPNFSLPLNKQREEASAEKQLEAMQAMHTTCSDSAAAYVIKTEAPEDFDSNSKLNDGQQLDSVNFPCFFTHRESIACSAGAIRMKRTNPMFDISSARLCCESFEQRAVRKRWRGKSTNSVIAPATLVE